MTERLVRCVFGLFLFAAGITLLIRAELGAAPWDVFHTGVSELTGIGVGTIIVAVGVARQLIAVPARQAGMVGIAVTGQGDEGVVGLLQGVAVQIEAHLGHVGLEGVSAGVLAQHQLGGEHADVLGGRPPGWLDAAGRRW